MLGLRSGPWPNNRADEENQLQRVSFPACDFAKVGFAKLYDRKTPITAADLLNDRVLPFFDSHEN